MEGLKLGEASTWSWPQALEKKVEVLRKKKKKKLQMCELIAEASGTFLPTHSVTAAP